MAISRELRLALITDPAMPELQPDDAGLPAAFAALGVETVVTPWGEPLPGRPCDGALVRSPWEYFMDPERFLRWLEAVEAPVLNSPAILRWNHDKRYLLDLARTGAARIPPTVLLKSTEIGPVADPLLQQIGAARGVLKPTVSGGAWRTALIERGESVPGEVEVTAGGDFLLQAFVEELSVTGEWSLTYFDGQYSHAVLKRSSPGDFRVQEEFGGSVEFVHPPPALLREAEGVLRAVPGGVAPVYGRVDMVVAASGRPYLMELELIEPELFLRARPGSAETLVRATLAALGAARSANEA
jgi:glutathione synthase/RimK-type ligase-like ATP-grasp enzyme